MQERLRRVGKGQDIPDKFEFEPQQWLRQSHHPYAPFTGSAYEWGSWVYDDGTTFEGLVRNSIPHGKGVMQMGVIGKGAGFSDTKLGDMYEGEFHTGWAHGIGRYTTADGLVFKGEFTAAQKDGCGAMYDLKPWKDLIAEGKDPRKAWKMAKAEIFERARYGTWRNDNFVSEPTDLGSFCSLGDIQKTLVSVDNVVNGARMFTFRPDGQATMHKMLLPDSEAPAPVMQHPLHYPHGTLFMAPGPAGQTEGIPDSPALKALMLKENRNYMRIHERYNFDYVPASDSLMAKVLRWGAKRDKIKQREEALEKQRADRRLRKIRGEDSGFQQEPTPSAALSSKQDDKPDDDDDGGFDDSDLLASASAIIAQQPQSRASSGVGPTAFGSITLSMSRAHHGLGTFFENLAKRAPPMPRLGVDRRH